MIRAKIKVVDDDEVYVIVHHAHETDSSKDRYLGHCFIEVIEASSEDYGPYWSPIRLRIEEVDTRLENVMTALWAATEVWRTAVWLMRRYHLVPATAVDAEQIATQIAATLESRAEFADLVELEVVYESVRKTP